MATLWSTAKATQQQHRLCLRSSAVGNHKVAMKRHEHIGSLVSKVQVNITHAIYRKTLQVSVPSTATLKQVREQVCRTTNADFNEVILVGVTKNANPRKNAQCRGCDENLMFYARNDDEMLGRCWQLLALGSNWWFRPKRHSDMQSELARADVTGVTGISTFELLKTRNAQPFLQGQAVREGQTIRIEASGWRDDERPNGRNSFTIDLLTDSGDVALHWGARLDVSRVIRNSQISGRWSVEELAGDWPHRQHYWAQIFFELSWIQQIGRRNN